MRAKLMAVQKRLNRFIAKQSDQNDDLHNLQAQPGYSQFEADLAAAIMVQAVWTAKQLKNLADKYISDDLEALTTEQQAQLSLYLANNMPDFATEMANTTVYNWYKRSFEHGVAEVYDYHDLPVNFELTNVNYLAQIQADTNTILNKSTLDDTTRKALVNLITTDKEAGMTVPEISRDIRDRFPKISSVRADMIARTETVNMMNQGQFAALKESGVQYKAWVAYGSNPCPTCLANAGDDFIPMDSMFSSGDLMPTAHPRCECQLDYKNVEIDPAQVWSGE